MKSIMLPAICRRIILPLSLLLLLVTGLLPAGCIGDDFSTNGEQTGEGDGEVPVTIRLVTRFGGPSTRGLTDAQIATAEGQVEDVYVFFLRVSDGKVHSVVKGEDITNTSDTERTFTAALQVAGSAGQAFRCIVVANAGEILLNEKNLNSYKDKTYDDLQNMLVPDDDDAYTSTPAAITEDDCFVMWGEANEKVYATQIRQSIHINMIRALARLDIGVGTNPSKWDGLDEDNESIPFVLKQVYIFKPNNKYAFMPLTGAYNATDKEVIIPSPKGTFLNTPFVYDVDNGAKFLKARIYLPEADVVMKDDDVTGATGVSGDVNHENRCAIVVKGSYNSRPDSYYRIDFHNNTVLADVLRNHRYSATITSVKGDGEANAEDAYKSKRVNLTAHVLNWTDWTQNVIFDGLNHVYVEKKKILLPGNAGLKGYIFMSSNVDTSKWLMKINPEDGGSDTGVLANVSSVDNEFFKVTRPPSGVEGGNLMIETKQTLPDQDGVPYTSKTASVTIKIERLEVTIQIEQRSDTPEDWIDGGGIGQNL